MNRERNYLEIYKKYLDGDNYIVFPYFKNNCICDLLEEIKISKETLDTYVLTLK